MQPVSLEDWRKIAPYSPVSVKWCYTFVEGKFAIIKDSYALVIFESLEPFQDCYVIPWKISNNPDIKYLLDPKYHNYYGYFMSCEDIQLLPSKSFKSVDPSKDGCFCLDCKNFYYMAAPNTAAGLVCYSCRSTNAWKHADKTWL